MAASPSSPFLRSVQLVLTLLLIGGQLAFPLAAIAQPLQDSSPSVATSATLAGPPAPPLTLADLDAQFVQLLRGYLNAPETESASETLQRGYTFAQALHVHALQRELFYTARPAARRQTLLPIQGLSLSQVNAAFMHLLGAYLAIPADLEDASRARYEDAFGIGFQILALQSDRLARDASPKVVTDGSAQASFDAAFVRGLEAYLNAPADPPLNPSFVGHSYETGGPGEIESGNLWGLEASDPASGEEASWLISADPDSLAAFDAAFTEAMHAPASVETQGAATLVPRPEAWTATDRSEADHVFIPPAKPSTGPAPSRSAAPLYREGGIAGFVAHIVTTGGSIYDPVFAADVDHDGDMDILTADASIDNIVWHKNDGSQNFTAHNISTIPTPGVADIYAADVDHDGDMDVLAAVTHNDQIRWYENDGASSPSFTSHLVHNAGYVSSVHAADVDGDGDMDVLATSISGVLWYENDGSQTFTQHLIADLFELGAESVYATDMDLDGDMDVLSASSGDDRIAWYENDGSQSFTTHTITNTANNARSVYAADMDSDGDMDVLSASMDDNKIAWYENDGWQNFTSHTITVGAYSANSVYAADMDGDSDVDVMSASFADDQIAWYENDGAQPPGFTTHTVTNLADGASDVYAADVDGDGDTDMLSASGNDGTIAWYENRTIHYSADFPGKAVIAPVSTNYGYQSLVADLDNDADLDVLFSTYENDHEITWYENEGGEHPAFTRHTITGVGAWGINDFCIADVNSDGHADIVSSESDDLVVWYENDKATPPSFTAHSYHTTTDEPVNVSAADLDGDGDMDLLSNAHSSLNVIVWYENDGSQVFTEHSLAGSNGSFIFEVVDMNRDGHLDLITEDGGSDSIAWHRNDGSGTFTKYVIPTSFSGLVQANAIDVDSDGDVDLLASFTWDDTLAWYENIGGEPLGFTEHIITSTADGIKGIAAADVDSDGDMDILAEVSSPWGFVLYENEGAQIFTAHHIETPVYSDISSADVDGDGDLDVFLGDPDLVWYENTGGQFKLETVATAPAILENSQITDVLQISMSHRGRAGDDGAELATLGLRFADASSTPLTTTQANALFDTLYLYTDDGSGTFEAVNDTLITTVADLALSATGQLTLTMPDGDPNVAVNSGTARTFFVALQLATDAERQSLHNLQLAHVTEETGHSTAQNSLYDTPLALESPANITATLFIDSDWSHTIGNPGLSGGDVNAVAIDGAGVYAGGSFTGRVAHWNGSAWSTLGSLDGDVHALVISGTTLYAGGAFTGHLARWNGSAWETAGGGLNNTVYALAAGDGALYVGGDFTGAGGVPGADRIARWEGSVWHALGSGANGTVRTIALDGIAFDGTALENANVYIGGSFTNPSYPYIARWDGATWQPLGGAILGDVYALSVVGSDLYAGGYFDAKISRWDGGAWHTVGDGVGGPAPFVKALASNGSDLYVGGLFTGTGGISSPNVARWNGWGWSSMNWGTNGPVNALAVGSNGPVAGGTFTAVDGDVPANKVAAWEPPLTDVTLSHTVTPTTTVAGGLLTYTLTLTNSSALTATTVTLRDTLPEGLTLLAQSGACTAAGQVVTCTIGSLAPGTTQGVTLTVATAIANGLYANTASVSADQPESNGADNVASAPPVSVTIESDLALAMDGPAGGVAGRSLTYTLVVTNHGPNTAPNAVLTDSLPTDLVFVAATAGCTGASGAVTCTLGDLPVGVTRTVTLTASVPAALSARTVTNTAGVTSGALDPAPGNESAQAATWVSVTADLGGALLAPPSVCISGTLYSTLVVSNSGPSLATGASLNNALPAGTTFASASAACTHDGGTPGRVTCAVGDLAPDASRTYTVALGLAGFNDYDVITHTLSVTATSPDPAPENNTAALTTTIRTDCSALQADLSLVKAAPVTVAAGGWVTYTLTARNHGSREATGVRFGDHLPAGVSFETAASDPACTEAGGIVCTVGSLAVGQSRSYTLVGRVAVDTPFGTPLTNSAAISGTEADFLPDNNQDSAISTVILESDLALSKTAPVTASTGAPMVYTLTVTNHGPSHAAGLVLSDTLPPGVLYEGASASQGTCAGDDVLVTCTLGALNAQASVSVWITVTPFQSGNLVNEAQVAAATPDPVPGNDSASATTLISAGAGRETRTYGYLRVTANAFMDAGGGQVQALGDIWLGAEGGEVPDPIALNGDADTLTIDTGTNQASGNGTVTLRDGDQSLFHGDFVVSGTLTTPLLLPGRNLSYNFDALADFQIEAGLTVTDTNLSTGGTRGHAMLAVQSQALSQTLQADFEILPGPEYVATLEAFSFVVAGCTVTVTAPRLGNTGIGADQVLLTLPEHLGKTSVNVAALEITPDSLSFGDVGATFPLPDIKFGNGEKVKIVDTEAGLLYMRTSDAFAFTASGTLSLTLPSNQQAIALGLRVDTEGNLSARLDQLSLKVAGGTLQMQDILMDNSGLAVANAILTLPPSFKGATATLSDVTITGDGLSIGGAGATFPLPDLKIGSGKKVKFVDLAATLEIANLTGGDQEYVFGIQGEMQLRLPQNAQDIQFTAQLDSSGAFNGTLDQLRLTMAGGKATLQLESIAFDNSGLDVETGTLALSLGSTPVTGVVTALRIDDSGLSVGGGSVTVAIPDVKVGSGKSFSLTDATVTLELGGDRSYKLTLAGTMQITIPGANSSATASLSVDGDGRVTGSVQSFALTVAGLGLAIEQATFKDGMLLVDKAALEIPPAWGGLKAELYHLRVGGSSGLSIGGGKFTLPDIKVGKITMAGLEGGFVPVAGGYEISAQGLFKVPALGGGPNCGIKVGVTLYAESGRTVMAIHTLEPPEGLAEPVGTLLAEEPLLQPSLSNLALKDVTCGLDGCRIPIAATGFFLSRVEGALTLDKDTTHIDLGVTIVTGFGLGTIPAVAGDADLGIDFDPFQMDLVGAVTLFALFKAAELDATVRSGFFSAELQINQIWPPFRGEAGLTAWTTDGSFHLVGHASLTVGFKKGQLWRGCVDLLLDTVCVNVPPVNASFGGIHTEFGEFRRDSGTTWGLKGWVGVHIPWPVDEDVNIGFYFDTDGDLAIGNVNGYRTITPPSVARARELWEAQRAGRLMATLSKEERELLTAYHFDPQNPTTVDTDVTIATRSDVLFYMARTSVSPTMALVDPLGTVITPDNLPSNTGYEEVPVTRTVSLPVPHVVTDTQVMYGVKDAEPGTWRIRLTGEPAEGEGYIVDVLGVVPQPVLSDLSATNSGSTSAQVAWRLSTIQPTTTLGIYVTPGPISTTLTTTGTQGGVETTSTPLFSGFPIGTDVPTLLDGTPQSTTLDLSGLESGTYYVWLDANDGRNPPVRAYAPSPFTVEQPWQHTWTANLQATPGFRQLALRWDASPHPDVDGYTVYVNTEPIVPMAGQALEMGDLVSTTLHSLTPGRTYYLTLGAVDEETGRVALSESITAIPWDAPFTLAATPRNLTVVAGETATAVLNVTTTLTDYPGVVDLDASTPDGLVLTTATDVVTPTTDGVAVGLTLSATARLPGGTYTVTLKGRGAGLNATLPLTLTVQEPTFTLNAPPAVTLHEGDSVALTVTAEGAYGASDPIYLSLDGVPAGLLATWSQRTLAPGASASLAITDTALLNNGVYTLTLSGEDGHNTVHTEVVLRVVKPGFALASARPRRIALHGETVTYTLELNGFSWSEPVRIALDSATSLPGSEMGFRLNLNAQDPLSDVITVTAPAQIALVTRVSSATLPGRYRPTVLATSQAKQAALELELIVYETATTADLEVGLPDSLEVTAGTHYAYTTTVTNLGPLTATNVILSDTLPAQWQWVSLVDATPSQGSCGLADRVVTCTLGDLARDASVNVRVEGAVSPATPDGTQLINRARVRTDQAEDNHLNNSSSGWAMVDTQATLTLSATATPDPVSIGGEVVYALTLTNDGPSDASEVQLLTLLPQRAAFSAASPGCTHTLGRVTCDLDLAAGSTAVVTVGARVRPGSLGTMSSDVTAVAANGSAPVEASVVVTLVDQPISGLLATQGGPTRLGSATTFTATSGEGTNVTYVWDWGDGSPPRSGPQPRHTYANVGRYTVTVTATNTAYPAGVTTTMTSIVYADYTWNGGLGTLWNEAHNWTPFTSQSPVRHDNVTLPAKVASQTWPVVEGSFQMRDLRLEAGSQLTLLDGAHLTVDGTLSNHGVLRQTVDNLSAGSPTRFLHLQNAAGTLDQYQGVDAGPAAPLGPVTVAVTGHAPCARVTGPTVLRCFDIAAEGSAKLTFHYLESERNGLDATAMRVWRWDAASEQWAVVNEDVLTRDSQGPDYAVTVSDASLAGQFVLRPGNVAPTADDDAFTVVKNSDAQELDVLAGDMDADADGLRVYAVGTSSQGGTIANDGTHISYAPAPGFVGTDTFTYTVNDGFGGFATAQVTVTVTEVRVYLPLVTQNYIPPVFAPDLVVERIVATADGVQVTIKNQGNAPVLATEEFFLQVYIAPAPAPSAVNQLWYELGDEGMFWGITGDLLPLAPGASLTVASGDAHYLADYGLVTWPLAAGTPIYAQVDAYNAATTFGVVQETHEILESDYNNVTGPVYVGDSSRGPGDVRALVVPATPSKMSILPKP